MIHDPNDRDTRSRRRSVRTSPARHTGGLSLLTTAVAAAMMLSACTALSGYPPESGDPDAELAALQTYFDPNTIPKYNAETDPAQRKRLRDEVVYGRLRAYDINYKKFVKALTGGNNLFSIGTDWLVIGLNAAGATVGGEAAKSALSASSAGVVGAKGSVDKNLFYEKTLPAIVAQMEARRMAALVPIEKGLAQSDTEYPLYKALSDLAAYDAAGSIPGAITGIVENAGSTASQAQEQLKFVRDASFTASYRDAALIHDRLARLTPAQALQLAKTMEPHLSSRPEQVRALVNRLDPTGERLKSGSAAKLVLQAWQTQDERDTTSLKQWTDALDAVEHP